MESMGEWTASLGGMYTTTEEADFMAQLLGSYENHHDGSGGGGGHQSTARTHQGFWVGSHENTGSYMYSMDGVSFEQDSSSYSAGTSGYYRAAINNGSLDLGMDDTTINMSSYLVEETSDCNAEEYSGKIQTLLEPAAFESGKNLKLELSVPNDQDNSRKRCRASFGDVQKNRRNTRARKIQKNPETNNDGEEEEVRTNKNKAVLNRQSSTNTCCSKDDSNESEESNGGGGDASTSKGTRALNLNGKTRAGRGAATDPQSLYARKRRERINERLRILQSLVPNGTKVDISTMLEEAVHYVKFLQLQIKLLSSDDLWMYAPIAYNGMDIGLDRVTAHR